MKTIARAIVFDIAPAMLTAAGAIHRASTIDISVDVVSSDANAGLKADAPRAHADTGSNADASCTRTHAGNDPHAARTGADAIPLPDAALRRAVRVAIDRGFSR
jgi:hypothetical protein